jgi:hypothetical protein
VLEIAESVGKHTESDNIGKDRKALEDAANSPTPWMSYSHCPRCADLPPKSGGDLDVALNLLLFLPGIGEAVLGGRLAAAITARLLPKIAGRAAEQGVKEGIYVIKSEGRYYVGQSGDIDRRLAQHLSSGKFSAADVSAAKRYEVLGGRTAREVAEQLKIDSLGGIDSGRLWNLVNPIGDKRILQLLGKSYVRP